MNVDGISWYMKTVCGIYRMSGRADKESVVEEIESKTLATVRCLDISKRT